MKLTEGWGEAKNYSKGEDDGFKMEEGEGEGEDTYVLFFGVKIIILLHSVISLSKSRHQTCSLSKTKTQEGII